MSAINNPDVIKYMGIFHSYALKRMQKMDSQNGRFAHYTSAATALSIIERGQLWLRNALLMNDFSEVEHGDRCLRTCWNDAELGGKLRTTMEFFDPQMPDRMAKKLNDLSRLRRVESYILSISEHDNVDTNEDRYGRLSMWRAYGGDTNVAFVFNRHPFFSDSQAIKVFSTPVLYADANRFSEEFLAFAEQLSANKEYLQAWPIERLESAINQTFLAAILSTKHPGFCEEREWRLIYSPFEHYSERLVPTTNIIQGVPQKIYLLDLKNYPEEGLTGASLPELLEEIIIGPTQNPYPIYIALSEALEAAGVEDARSKVRISDIPLRR